MAKRKPGHAKSTVVAKYPNAYRRKRLSQIDRTEVHEILVPIHKPQTHRIIGSGITPKDAWEAARATIFGEVLAS